MIRRTKRRMQLCIAFVCINLLFIWGNSLMPGTLSGAFSQWIKDLLSQIFPGLLPNAQSGTGILRKLAHFSEFALLGLWLSWLLGMLKGARREQIGFSLLSGFLVACTDEGIQYFVPGRNCSFLDVGIDTAGVVTGIILFHIGYLIIMQYHNKMEEKL